MTPTPVDASFASEASLVPTSAAPSARADEAELELPQAASHIASHDPGSRSTVAAARRNIMEMRPASLGKRRRRAA
jgi:hypothetical protein